MIELAEAVFMLLPFGGVGLVTLYIAKTGGNDALTCKQRKG